MTSKAALHLRQVKVHAPCQEQIVDRSRLHVSRKLWKSYCIRT